MSGWRQHLSVTLLHLRWWPSPRRAGELAAHSAAPPRTGLQRPLLRPRRGEGQHGVGFGCSCTGSFPGWGSAGSWLLHGLCSACGERGALPGCRARPSPRSGFSCHRLQQWQSGGAAAVDPRLWSAGSMVVVQGLSSSDPRGILLDQGLNSCPLHWQHSLP